MKIPAFRLVAFLSLLIASDAFSQVAGESAQLPAKGPDVKPGEIVKSGAEKGGKVVVDTIQSKADNPGKTAAETAGGYVGGAVGGVPGKVIGSKLAGAAYQNIKDNGAPQKQADDAVDRAQHPDMGGPDRSRPYYDDQGKVHYPDKNQKMVKDPDTGRMVLKWKSSDEISKDAAKQAAQKSAREAAKEAAKDAAKDAGKQAAQNTVKEVGRPPVGGGGGGGCGGPCGR